MLCINAHWLFYAQQLSSSVQSFITLLMSDRSYMKRHIFSKVYKISLKNGRNKTYMVTSSGVATVGPSGALAPPSASVAPPSANQFIT